MNLKIFMENLKADFILKVVSADWDSYNKFLTTELTSAPNVSHVKSALAIRTSKHAFGIPIPIENPVSNTD